MTDQQITELTEAISKLATKQQPSWYEHVDLMSSLVYAAFAWIFWKLNRNIDDLYRKYNSANKELQQLQGAHNALTGNGTHSCKREEDEEE